MSSHVLMYLLNILMIAGGVFTLYNLYFVVIALFGLKKPKEAPYAAPKTRFAVVVAARNEEQVIGNLVDSLQKQNYPRDLYDIYVAPNNCTDDTRGAALQHGALIFDPVGTIKSKGDVLKQVVAQLMDGGRYDAMCVFDADNLVHPDFLQKMNNAHRDGVQVAQGFRDSKNPIASAVSTCYSVCYWMVNRFYNGGREALGFSGLVNGSGFMVSIPLLRKLGGWNTKTMTEDYEFSAQCVLQGHKVHYVSGAVIYDEQPLTFAQSWKQRRRWSTGSVQGMEIYLHALLSNAVHKRDWVSLDLAFTFMMPLIQLITCVLGLVTLVASAYQMVHFNLLPFTELVGILVLALGGAFVVCMALATFVIWLNRKKNLQGTGKGVAYFAFFLLSWLPIGLISLFKKIKTWDAIHHTCNVNINELK